MKLYETGEGEYVAVPFNKTVPNARLLFNMALSEKAYEQFEITPYEFLKLAALMEVENTSIENIVEEYLNGEKFVLNDRIWVRGVKTIAELINAVVDHASYLTEKEYEEYLAEEYEEPIETVRNRSDYKKVSFGGYAEFAEF